MPETLDLPSRYSGTPRIATNAAGIWSRESRIERSRDSLTATAVRGVPSENTTPGRRCSRTDRASSSRAHFSQSAGARFPWESVVTSLS